jgi:hypothetical protein
MRKICQNLTKIFPWISVLVLPYNILKANDIETYGDDNSYTIIMSYVYI